MTTRRRIWIFVLLAIVVAALAFWITRSNEPRYRGKQLSAWLMDLKNAHPSFLVVEERPPEIIAAAKALGTNAIPFLLEEIQARDSAWKLKFDAWLTDNFRWERKSVSASDRRLLAGYGFWVLGKLSEPAIPKLSALITNTDNEIASAVVIALRAIDSEKTLPTLVSALTNQSLEVRQSAARAFLFHPVAKPEIPAVIPALINALNDTDSVVVRISAQVLNIIGLEPEHVIPALTAKLNHSDSRVRAGIASALGSFGTNAISAFPAIQQLYDNADPRGRRRLARALVRIRCEMHDGGIVRGPKDEKKIALVFTGHEFAEGGEMILTELTNHQAEASFFLTGTFLDNPENKELVQRVVEDGHYLAPHSDKHLLYCSWNNPEQTLLTHVQFVTDLTNNVQKIQRFLDESPRLKKEREDAFARIQTNAPLPQGIEPGPNWALNYFLPAYEYYNRQIVWWTRDAGGTLINHTPGTRSNADYMGEADKNFVSSQKIFDSIVRHEQEDPNGLNGFILLLHIGVGPNRADKFHNRFGELLDHLAGKGYQFVRVDELLEPKMDTNATQRPFPNPNPNAPFRRR